MKNDDLNQNKKHHVCPVWIGYLLASPLRRLFENPYSILSPFVKRGDTILELGPAMGFFTIPLSRLVGKDGLVLAVDVQKKMLQKLEKKLSKDFLDSRVRTILCNEKNLKIDEYSGRVNLAVLFYVVHEVKDKTKLFYQVYNALKPGSKVLILEPKKHVSIAEFTSFCQTAKECGFVKTNKKLPSKRGWSAVYERK